MKTKTKRVALSGVLSAVAILLMSVGSVVTVLDMSAAYMAGFCVIISRIELDRASAWGVYLVSGVLAFVLLPDKFVAVAFLCYGGIYPIIKELCETVKSKWLMWGTKIIASNILLTLMIWLGKYFTVATDDALGFEIWIYVLGNFIFIVYDMALTLVIARYYQIFRRRRSGK